MQWTLILKKLIRRSIRKALATLILLTFSFRYKRLSYRLDLKPLIIIFLLTIRGLKSKGPRGYTKPSYLLELFVNESGYAKAMYMKRASLIIKRFLEDIDKEATILDIGCGIGTALRYLKELIPLNDLKKLRAVLCDISPLMLYISRLRFKDEINIGYILCNGESLPFKQDNFDVIVSYEVLEHLKDPLSMLKQIFEVANKEKSLILINYDIDWPDPLHIAPYNRKDFEKALSIVAKHYGFIMYKIEIPEAKHNPLYVLYRKELNDA